MRKWIDLFEHAGPAAILARRYELLGHLQLDDASAANILEMDEDDEDLAEAWFDHLLRIYQFIESKGRVPIYRHMKVEDFTEFMAGLKNGAGLGQHWSIHPNIESPTWEQDHHGDVEVFISGEIGAQQVNWEATLRQNFEWPHEGELIFDGDVFVQLIEDREDDVDVKVGMLMKR